MRLVAMDVYQIHIRFHFLWCSVACPIPSNDETSVCCDGVSNNRCKLCRPKFKLPPGLHVDDPVQFLIREKRPLAPQSKTVVAKGIVKSEEKKIRQLRSRGIFLSLTSDFPACNPKVGRFKSGCRMPSL